MQNHLNLDIDTFGFVEREKIKGKTLRNQCGRDFLYYALNFYRPDVHNSVSLNPESISRSGLFGYKNIPEFLIWTGLTFRKAPKYLKSLDLTLTINNRSIKNYFDFLLATLPFKRISYNIAIKHVENSVDQNKASGIDISIVAAGLIDHVMFVYGYDDENLYVFDTHKISGLEYEKMADDSRFIMKLPKEVIKRRWTIFGRVWIVTYPLEIKKG